MKIANHIRGIAIFILSLYGAAIGGTLKSEGEGNEAPETISLVLLGRRGAGITSTVRQILGPQTTIHAADVAVASTDILEYTLRLQPSTGEKRPVYLKLVDVPGLELTDNLEHDSEILSTLKSYLHDKGLPTFFLVVYRFDDKEIAQPDSQFRLLLKRVEYFQKALFQTTTDNLAFLLTRLLNEPNEVQQSPNARIDEFRAVIQESLSLQSPIEIIVGDNKPDESTVQIENGFIKLPNGELYPKNIWEKLLQISDRSLTTQLNKDIIKSSLTAMIENRESAKFHTQELVAHATDEDTFESDLEAFEYLLRQRDVNLPRNEVQLFLQLTYEEQDAPTQIASCAQLLALQICLRNLHLESIQQLPQTQSGIVKLFQQDMEGVMTSKYSLFYLRQALDLEVPEYPSQNLVVGHGYDLLNDKLLRRTPFLKNPSKRPSSSLGFQFPDFMECEKLTSAEEVVLANSTDTKEEYQLERLKYLTIPDRENVVISQLKGESKDYLNLKAKDSGRLVAIKETRILECKMVLDNDSVAILDESFVSTVNNIVPLNSSDVESVTEWKLLFHQYGTHVVIKGFGGGCYQGTLFLEPEGHSNVLSTSDSIRNTLSNIVSLQGMGSEHQTSNVHSDLLVYKFHADEGLDIRASHINQLNDSDKSQILNDWKRDLNFNFEMLAEELELVPLSQIVGIVNSTKGNDAAVATKLLLQGNLEVSRQPGANNEIDLHDNVTTRLKRANNQADALKLANLDKTVEKYDQLNKFLDDINE